MEGKDGRRETEGEIRIGCLPHVPWLEPRMEPARQVHVFDQESNPWPFHAQTDALTTEENRYGSLFFFCVLYKFFFYKVKNMLFPSKNLAPFLSLRAFFKLFFICTNPLWQLEMKIGLLSPWPFLIFFNSFFYMNLLILHLHLTNFQAFKKLISAITITWIKNVFSSILCVRYLLFLAYKFCQPYWITFLLCKHNAVLVYAPK